MPVFKVNNNPQNAPVRPPWMRQDSIPQVNNSAPWRRQQSVAKGEPQDEPVAAAPPQQAPQQGPRKQSKIEIIPSMPSNKSVPSALACPPPMPAPPSNPNLASAPKKENTIQVSSRKVAKLQPRVDPPKAAEPPKQEVKVEPPNAANGVQKKNALNEEKSFKTQVIDIKTAEANKPTESANPVQTKNVSQSEAKPAAQRQIPIQRQQTVQVSLFFIFFSLLQFDVL
jgi:hypothetical protein